MRIAILILAVLVFAAFLVVDTTALLRLAAACITGAFGYAPAVGLAVVAVLVLLALLSRRTDPPRRMASAGRSSTRRGASRKATAKPASGRKPAAKTRQGR
jgi:hypothetical protein